MREFETFGRWLKRSRSAQSITQAVLAQRVGCAVVTLRKIESGDIRPSRQLADRLMAQLGIDWPENDISAETVASTTSVRSHTIPAPLTALFGREEIVGEACALLRGSTRLLTLVGPGGIGKTRLAIQIVTSLVDDFADGVFFVDLSPIRDPDLVLLTVAKVLRLNQRSMVAVFDLLVQELQKKRLLVVLDNVEQVLASTPEVASLLGALPGLSVIVTSRVVLQLYGERVFAVPPLALPPALDQTGSGADRVSQLAAYPAVALFVACAQAISPRFVLTPANVTAIAAICTRLDGLPLAIELAAACSRFLSPQAVLTRLERRLNVLTSGPANFAERHQTLRATIDWSYGLLKPHERQLFMQLSVFTGGCTLEGVGAVCGEASSTSVGGSQPPQLLDTLETLLNHTLLTSYVGVDGEAHFTMLETIREYAQEQLEASETMPVLKARHSAYYLALAEMAEQGFDSAEETSWLNRLESEHDNLRAVLAWNLSPHGDPMVALRLGASLARFWQLRDYVYLRQGRNWLLAALAATSPEPSLIRAKALHSSGLLSRYLNEQADAASAFEQSLQMSRLLDNSAGIAQTLYLYGDLAVDRSEYDLARDRYTEGLELARALDDKPLIAWILLSFGYVARWRLDLVESDRFFEKSLAVFRLIEARRGIATALWTLSRNAKDQSNYQRATAFAQESLSIFQELGDQNTSAMAFFLLGEIAQTENQNEQALAHFDNAVALARRLHSRRLIAWVQTIKGQLKAMSGELEAAHSCFAEGKQLFEDVNDPEGRARVVFELACLAMLEGDNLAARHMLEVYVPLVEELGRPRESMLGRCLVYVMEASLGDQHALARLERATLVARRAGDTWGMSIALRLLGFVLLSREASLQAVLCVQECLTIAHELDDRTGVLIQLLNLATAMLRTEQYVQGAYLCGAVAKLETLLGVGSVQMALTPPERTIFAQTRNAVGSLLDNPVLAKAWETGQTLSLPDVVTLAQSLNITLSLEAPAPPDAPAAAEPELADEEFSLRQYTAELEAANEELEAFVYAISHDLRAPLRAIDGYTSMLVEDYEQHFDEESQRMVGVIRRETGRMGQLISDLLVFARFGTTALRMQSIDMNHLVQDVYDEVTLLSDRARLTLNLDSLLMAMGDPSVLRQVLVNLLSNAVKYSSHRPQAVIYVRSELNDGMCTYHIQDNGAGFDMQYVSKLFGVFQRLHSEREFPGTGVGLAIAQRIVHRHGGQIWAEGRVGYGATFSFTLPAARAH